MLKKKWLLKEIDKARVLEISKTFGVSPLTSIVLYNRGIRDDMARSGRAARSVFDA